MVLHDDELVSHVKAEGLTAISVVPLRLDVNSITPCYPENTNEKRINIVHAPSGNGKGTKWFLEAMEKLSQKHNINLILIRNLPQQEAFKEYMKADIIFDQITVGTYGVFAIEAMAMGKPVITYISEDMKKKLPKDLPIVSATPDSLYGVLESLILDSELRNHLGKQGRQYACKYHDCGNNAAVLKAIYEGKENGLTGEAAFNQVVRKV